jgi:GNAT superfamily N-acetyltransferase
MSDTYTNGHDHEPFTIVPMTLAHLPAVRLLYKILVEEKQPLYPVFDDEELDNFTRCLAQCLVHPEQPERWPGWVAMIGDLVVGFLFGEREIRIVGKPKDIWVAHWMVVRPGYRGQGVGQALSRAGIAWLTARNVPLVELAAFAGDEQWQARGWAPILTRYVASVETIREAITPKQPTSDASIMDDLTVAVAEESEEV